MVHPHSMEGIYDKDHAPLFASDKPEEWVRYLESIWSSQQTIENIKKRDKEYLESMERFVDSEYRRFYSTLTVFYKYTGFICSGYLWCEVFFNRIATLFKYGYRPFAICLTLQCL